LEQLVCRPIQSCVVLKGLRAHGFTADLRHREVTYAVDVTTLPGIDGPELTFNTPVSKGTAFVVTSVRESWNCPFDRISYGVEIHDIPELAAHKVFAGPKFSRRRKRSAPSALVTWGVTPADV